jgi:diguanylate cyclase (GGDEF)-like protein
MLTMKRTVLLIAAAGLAGLVLCAPVIPEFCAVHFLMNGLLIILIVCAMSGQTLALEIVLALFVVGIAFMVKAVIGNGSLCLICLVPIGLSVGLVLFLKKMWDDELLASEKRKELIDEEIIVQNARLDNKKMTLVNLEQQVSDIIDLFEVAKDFNECLTEEAVVHILKDRVAQYLPCERSILIMLHDEVLPRLNYRAYVLSKTEDVVIESSGSAEGADVTDFDHFIQACIDHKDVIRVDYPVQYEDYFEGEKGAVVYPLWLFPLIVENKLIAAYIVNGGTLNDFPKFSIIASQLALQIKKIKLYEDVKELSITDGLTKFFLRRHFTERFEEELKRSIKYGHNLCVLMIDVDHFKEYNDNYGHLVGDATLREVANIVRDNIRKVDLTGRYGGEEFILVLPETNKEGGIDAAERIRSSVARKSLKVYDEETKITISVGMSAFPADVKVSCKSYSSEIMDALIKKADENLYRAKQDGRNRVVS